MFEFEGSIKVQIIFFCYFSNLLSYSKDIFSTVWHHFAGRLKDAYEWTIIKNTRKYSVRIINCFSFVFPLATYSRQTKANDADVRGILFTYDFFLRFPGDCKDVRDTYNDRNDTRGERGKPWLKKIFMFVGYRFFSLHPCLSLFHPLYILFLFLTHLILFSLSPSPYPSY